MVLGRKLSLITGWEGEGQMEITGTSLVMVKVMFGMDGKSSRGAAGLWMEWLKFKLMFEETGWERCLERL